MERLKAEEARLREQQQYGDWQKKEEHFHLKQAKQRTKVTRRSLVLFCLVIGSTHNSLIVLDAVIVYCAG